MAKRFNKKVFNYIERIMNSNDEKLSDVYKSWCQANQDGYDYCKKRCYDRQGYNFKIIAANSYNFTVGYFYDKVDEETGEVIATMMVIHTAWGEQEYDITDYITDSIY